MFTNPMIKSRHIEALNNGYVQFLRALTKIVPYYNFSGLNDITINNENYVDPSHYSAYIGDMMINVIENGNRYEKLYQQGFGWYVNEDNFNDLVPLLETK